DQRESEGDAQRTKFHDRLSVCLLRVDGLARSMAPAYPRLRRRDLGRGGAVEPRTTSSGLKLSFSTVSPRILAINMRVARSTMMSARCRAVVSGGHEWRENGLSSNPAIDTSYGTCRPVDCAAASAPAAISS